MGCSSSKQVESVFEPQPRRDPERNKPGRKQASTPDENLLMTICKITNIETKPTEIGPLISKSRKDKTSSILIRIAEWVRDRSTSINNYIRTDYTELDNAMKSELLETLTSMKVIHGYGYEVLILYSMFSYPYYDVAGERPLRDWTKDATVCGYFDKRNTTGGKNVTRLEINQLASKLEGMHLTDEACSLLNQLLNLMHSFRLAIKGRVADMSHRVPNPVNCTTPQDRLWTPNPNVLQTMSRIVGVTDPNNRRMEPPIEVHILESGKELYSNNPTANQLARIAIWLRERTNEKLEFEQRKNDETDETAAQHATLVNYGRAVLRFYSMFAEPYYNTADTSWDRDAKSCDLKACKLWKSSSPINEVVSKMDKMDFTRDQCKLIDDLIITMRNFRGALEHLGQTQLVKQMSHENPSNCMTRRMVPGSTEQTVRQNRNQLGKQPKPKGVWTPVGTRAPYGGAGDPKYTVYTTIGDDHDHQITIYKTDDAAVVAVTVGDRQLSTNDVDLVNKEFSVCTVGPKKNVRLRMWSYVDDDYTVSENVLNTIRAQQHSVQVG
jgi:hypothetical protein